MAIVCYHAMTAAELSTCDHLPAHVGWLACHFSLSGPGLSNIPKELPANSLLILDDSAPFHHHQPEVILRQLQETISALEVRAVILDLQRPNDPGVQNLVSMLQRELPCSVPAPPQHSSGNHPVFLPPCPLNLPLERHLASYQGREIWLDAAPFPTQITVTAQGYTSQALSMAELRDATHWEPELYCNYKIALQDDRIIFTLSRDADAFCSWLEYAETLGVTAAIGLYQELKQQKPPC